MTRTQARDYCFKMIFEYQVQHADASEMLAAFFETHEDCKKQAEYITRLVTETVLHIEEIDSAIEQHTHGWKIQRLPAVTLAALRVAVCEIMYLEDIPNAIAINEAINLIKLYQDEKSGKFANGVLSSVLKSCAE